MRRRGFIGGGRADTLAPDTEGWVRSQNMRVIDRIRAAFGLGNQSAYSVGVAPSVQPVTIIEPDSVPPLQFIGSTPASAGAGGAGNRSEVTIAIATGFFPGGALLEVNIDLLAIPTTGYAVCLGATIAGATNLSLPYNDVRLGLQAMFAISTKNTAAASAVTTNVGGNILPPTNMTSPVRVGPFYLTDIPGQRNILVKAAADNLPVAVVFHWRMLFKAV